MFYKRYRNKIVDLLKITKEAFYKKFFQENRKNSWALWSGINVIIYSKKSSKTIPPSSISVEGKTISDPQNIAENFNNFFTSIGKNIQKKSSQLRNNFLTTSKTPSLTLFSFHQQHQKKSTNKYKSCRLINLQVPIADTLSGPLSELINKSFLSGIFPNVFEIAKEVPVFKAESRINCSNYRPISLLSNIGKIIEKLIHNRLNVFLEKKQIYLQFSIWV